MMNRRMFLIAAPAATLLPAASFAGQAPVFSRGGIAINGYDPVAYFTQSTHVKGSAEHSHHWNGATWQFSSAEHKEMFAADPAAFAPQYGGYCAYAVSKGATAKTDPDAWTIHNGKLYLNYDIGVRSIWSQDISGNIAKANINWPSVLG